MLTEDAQMLIKYMPEAVNALAARLLRKFDQRILYGVHEGEIIKTPTGCRMEVQMFPLYDQEEIFPDCTVQVLRNSVTGETSVGWWENKHEQ